MLKTTILLLTIFLVGCRSIDRRMICKQLDEYAYSPVTLCDISFKFNRCRCRTMDINSWNAMSDAIDLPIEACDGIAGYKMEDIANDIRPKTKAMFRLKGNLCQ